MSGNISWQLLGQGLLLGLGAAAPIGPVNVQIVRRTLRHGFHAGFFLGCGAVTVDVTYAILSSLGVGALERIARTPLVVHILAIASALLFTYLGVMSILAARRPPVLQSGGHQPSARGHYLTGLGMTLTNPMTLAFWFIAVPGAAGAGAAGATAQQLPILCAGVFLATLAWVIFFAGTISLVGIGKRNLWLIWADLLGGMTMLYFAGLAIWRIWRGSL